MVDLHGLTCPSCGANNSEDNDSCRTCGGLLILEKNRMEPNPEIIKLERSIQRKRDQVDRPARTVGNMISVAAIVCFSDMVLEHFAPGPWRLLTIPLVVLSSFGVLGGLLWKEWILRNRLRTIQDEIKVDQQRLAGLRHEPPGEHEAKPQAGIIGTQFEKLRKRFNLYALAGLLFGIVTIFLYKEGILPLVLFVPIIAVGLSLMGLERLPEYHGRGKVPAIIGLVWGSWVSYFLYKPYFLLNSRSVPA